MESTVNGVKTYPLALAQEMEALLLELSKYEHSKGVDTLFTLRDRAFDVMGILKRWL